MNKDMNAYSIEFSVAQIAESLRRRGMNPVEAAETAAALKLAFRMTANQ